MPATFTRMDESTLEDWMEIGAATSANQGRVADRLLELLGSLADITDGFGTDPADDQDRRDVDNFIFAFDTNLKPIVGQQITLDRHNGPVVGPRIDLLIQRATVGNCVAPAA